MQLLQPQEVEVYYILPAIRRELSLALKRLGKTQHEIAQLLGVTDAAVSQYVSKKRAKDARFPAEFVPIVKAAATRIVDKESMIRETQGILKRARDTNMICRLHAQVSGEIPKGCDACFGKVDA
jgi:predicted transcriptional regulator